MAHEACWGDMRRFGCKERLQVAPVRIPEDYELRAGLRAGLCVLRDEGARSGVDSP
jgi:hypothetical protein